MTTLVAVPESIVRVRAGRTLSTTWPAPLVQSRSGFQTASKHERRWRASWQMASVAERDEVVGLFDSLHGAGGVFQWTAPDSGLEEDFRFVDNTLRTRPVTRFISQIEVEVEALRA